MMISLEDNALWQSVARTVTHRFRHKPDSSQKSQPVPSAQPSAQPSTQPSAQPSAQPSVQPSAQIVTKSTPTIKTPIKTQKNEPANLNSTNYGGISKSDAARLKAGAFAIDGRLDLHGLTLAQARQHLGRFILGAAAQHKRTVLVVTGKGKNNTGVIRQHLPEWLNDGAVKHHIIAFSRAQPKDGGMGAFYLRLRTPT